MSIQERELNLDFQDRSKSVIHPQLDNSHTPSQEIIQRSFSTNFHQKRTSKEEQVISLDEIQPETWNNIPVCIVEAITAIKYHIKNQKSNNKININNVNFSALTQDIQLLRQQNFQNKKEQEKLNQINQQQIKTLMEEISQQQDSNNKAIDDLDTKLTKTQYESYTKLKSQIQDNLKQTNKEIQQICEKQEETSTEIILQRKQFQDQIIETNKKCETFIQEAILKLQEEDLTIIDETLTHNNKQKLKDFITNQILKVNMAVQSSKDQAEVLLQQKLSQQRLMLQKEIQAVHQSLKEQLGNVKVNIENIDKIYENKIDQINDMLINNRNMFEQLQEVKSTIQQNNKYFQDQLIVQNKEYTEELKLISERVEIIQEQKQFDDFKIEQANFKNSSIQEGINREQETNLQSQQKTDDVSVQNQIEEVSRDLRDLIEQIQVDFTNSLEQEQLQFENTKVELQQEIEQFKQQILKFQEILNKEDHNENSESKDSSATNNTIKQEIQQTISDQIQSLENRIKEQIKMQIINQLQRQSELNSQSNYTQNRKRALSLKKHNQRESSQISHQKEKFNTFDSFKKQFTMRPTLLSKNEGILNLKQRQGSIRENNYVCEKGDDKVSMSQESSSPKIKTIKEISQHNKHLTKENKKDIPLNQQFKDLKEPYSNELQKQIQHEKPQENLKTEGSENTYYQNQPISQVQIFQANEVIRTQKNSQQNTFGSRQPILKPPQAKKQLVSTLMQSFHVSPRSSSPTQKKLDNNLSNTSFDQTTSNIFSCLLLFIDNYMPGPVKDFKFMDKRTKEYVSISSYRRNTQQTLGKLQKTVRNWNEMKQTNHRVNQSLGNAVQFESLNL